MADDTTTSTGSRWADASPTTIITEMERIKATLDGWPPMTKEIRTAPGERLPFESLKTATLPWAGGLPVRVDPECPPGEVWLEMTKGPRVVIRNIAVPENSNG